MNIKFDYKSNLVPFAIFYIIALLGSAFFGVVLGSSGTMLFISALLASFVAYVLSRNF